MILKTRILFEDTRNEDLNIPIEDRLSWFKGSIDLEKITSWSEFEFDNKPLPHTEILFDNGESRVIKEEYEYFSALMESMERTINTRIRKLGPK
jgi:hypothetical protein